MRKKEYILVAIFMLLSIVTYAKEHTPSEGYIKGGRVRFYTSSPTIKTNLDSLSQLYSIDENGKMRHHKPQSAGTWNIQYGKTLHKMGWEFILEHPQKGELTIETNDASYFEFIAPQEPQIALWGEGLDGISPQQISRELGFEATMVEGGFGALDKTKASIYIASHVSLCCAQLSRLSHLNPNSKIIILSPSTNNIDNIYYIDESGDIISQIKDVIGISSGELSTQRGVTQRREPMVYEWGERHNNILNQVAQSAPKVVVLGNSIMHQWGGVEGFRIKRDSLLWAERIAPLNAINMGCGWDRVENVLWRVEHGALDGYKAQRVIVAIGVNNLPINSNEEIAAGIETLIKAIKLRQPSADIKICGIFPSRAREERTKALNTLIEKVAISQGAQYGNPGTMLLGNDNKINPSLFMKDGLHLNSQGYHAIVDNFLK